MVDRLRRAHPHDRRPSGLRRRRRSRGVVRAGGGLARGRQPDSDDAAVRRHAPQHRPIHLADRVSRAPSHRGRSPLHRTAARPRVSLGWRGRDAGGGTVARRRRPSSAGPSGAETRERRSSWLRSVAVTALVLAPAALSEELLFRGVPLVLLARGLGRGTAIVLLAIVFALAHLTNPDVSMLGIGNIALAGIFLGLAFYAPGGIWTAWGAHLGLERAARRAGCAGERGSLRHSLRGLRGRRSRVADGRRASAPKAASPPRSRSPSRWFSPDGGPERIGHDPSRRHRRRHHGQRHRPRLRAARVGRRAGGQRAQPRWRRPPRRSGATWSGR